MKNHRDDRVVQLDFFSAPPAPGLSPEQQRALVSAADESLVIAAAGSGKTRLLIERLFWALTDGDDRPIVALTFTDKAAAEMQARATVLLEQRSAKQRRAFAERITIATIDGYCLQILRDQAMVSGWSGERLLPGHDLPAFLQKETFSVVRDLGLSLHRLGLAAVDLPQALERVINLILLSADGSLSAHASANVVGAAQGSVVRGLTQLLDDIVHHNPELRPLLAGPTAAYVQKPQVLFGETLAAIDDVLAGRRLKAGPVLRKQQTELKRQVALFTPIDQTRYQAVGELLRLARALLSRYQTWKTSHRVFDFSDLAHAVLRLVANGHVLEPLSHLLIDEVQDTNPLQEALLLPLGHGAKVFRVGDPRQAIYGFRDADIEAMFTKRRSLPTDAVFELTVNHRSTAPILLVANHFWSAVGAHEGDFAPMQASRNEGAPAMPELVLVHKGDRSGKLEEAEWIADHLRTCPPTSTAVLCRTSAEARLVFAVFEAQGLEAQLRLRAPLDEEPAYADAVAILRAFDQPDDDLAIYSLLRTGVFGCSTSDIRALHRHSQNSRAVLALADFSLSGRAALAVSVFRDLLVHARHLPRQRLLSEFLGRLELGWRALAFAPVLAALNDNDGLGLALDEVIDRLALCLVDEVRGTGGGIEVMTIHGAKGLEWPTVILPFIGRRFEAVRSKPEVLSLPNGALSVRGEWPADQITAALDWETRRRERQEEFRLTYVALTRARDRLLLTATANKKKLTGQASEQTCLLDLMRVIFDFNCPPPGEDMLTGDGARLLIRAVGPAVPCQ